MKAAIYARYSSENQRPESIDDQVSACRKLAAARDYVVETVRSIPIWLRLAPEKTGQG